MSRIEKALEKAAKLRESQRIEAPAVAQRDINVPGDLPGFVTGESVVDPNKVNTHLVCITDVFSPAAEQYRKLRARILRATKKDFLNTIMVSSADIGDGKTVTAINLAVAMANEMDYTVILVDADLRKPSVHTYLGIEPKYGLSDYLAGKVSLPEVLIKTGIGGLVLLPAGSQTDNPAELLSSLKMRDLVDELKSRYKDRYVIFDSPPLLTVADALSLSGYVDGILFVLKAFETSQDATEKALSLLKGCRILGAVLNSVPPYLTRSIYPYYYRRYGKDATTKIEINGDNGKNATSS
ncbi:MAG: polysaccharide biosynthesis tyrosine autokinase [Dissulfurispiraceae bacterium]